MFDSIGGDGAFWDMLPKSADEIDGCPMAQVMPVVRAKWSSFVVAILSQGTLRFGELSRLMPWVTQANLTKELRNLEAHGLVHREVYREVPPKVEYSLTDLGRAYLPVVEAILGFSRAYGEAHGDE